MAEILIACVLDALLKDPAWGFHPVRLIGRFIAAQETLWYGTVNPLAGGAALALLTVGSAFACGWLLITGLATLHSYAGVAASAILIYFSISPSALAGEAMKIFRLLQAGDDAGARRELAMIVGRDTKDMTRPEIVRATVETVAENSVDGLIAPLFFAAIGGGPLALAYRAANTCDSMVGYRNERYEKFGKASARLDDAATFIPARLALVIVPVSALLLRMDAAASFRVGLGDRLKHPSPNSAHGEAAFAGALGVQLGGTSSYGGVQKEKPLLGDPLAPLDAEHIRRAVALLRGVTAVSALFFAFASLWR